MSTAPHFDIDLDAFWVDPYPALAELQRTAPIAFVPQLGATLFTRRDDIFEYEKKIDVFSSEQPGGLMTQLMGDNMMRRDGEAHMSERKAMFPAVSPRTVRDTWLAQFRADGAAAVAAMAQKTAGDLVKDFAMPISADALRAITGLASMTAEELDFSSQAMIDGCANYIGDPVVEARCHEGTALIDAHIDRMTPEKQAAPDCSILATFLQAGLPMDRIRANIKLAISGGQNEPRDAIAGAAWALLSHPDELARVRRGEFGWDQVFAEYVRWNSPIGMSPRRIAQPYQIGEIEFAPDDRVFFMFGAANRDPEHFDRPEEFDVSRDASAHIAFGAGPHFCAGAWASKALVAEAALPILFEAAPNMRLTEEPARMRGWAFRGLQNLPVAWA